MAGIQDLGRSTDTAVGHLTPGEVVIPRELQNPALNREINQTFTQAGQDPSRYVVGSPQNSVNPNTGHPEFFLGDVADAVGGALGGIGDAVGGLLGGSGEGILGGLGGSLLNAGLGAGLGAITGGGAQGAMMGGLGGLLGGSMGKEADLLGDFGSETLGFDLDETLGSVMGGLLMSQMGKMATEQQQMPGIPNEVMERQEEAAEPWDIQRPARDENMETSDYYRYGYGRERGLY